MPLAGDRRSQDNVVVVRKEIADERGESKSCSKGSFNPKFNPIGPACRSSTRVVSRSNCQKRKPAEKPPDLQREARAAGAAEGQLASRAQRPPLTREQSSCDRMWGRRRTGAHEIGRRPITHQRRRTRWKAREVQFSTRPRPACRQPVSYDDICMDEDIAMLCHRQIEDEDGKGDIPQPSRTSFTAPPPGVGRRRKSRGGTVTHRVSIPKVRPHRKMSSGEPPFVLALRCIDDAQGCSRKPLIICPQRRCRVPSTFAPEAILSPWA